MDRRVAIITGSTAGIGLAIARSLAAAGNAVVINGRRHDCLKQAEAEILGSGGCVLAIQGDASDADDIGRIVDRSVEHFGRIDILVNNAATVGVGDSVENMAVERWDEIIAVNLRGVFLFSKAAIPHIRRQRNGRIVNIGGLSAKNPLPFAAADAAAKAGVLALTRVLAAELGSFGITVNAVIPGLQTETELGRKFNQKLAEAFHISTDDAIAAARMRTLSKRFETLDEIGETVTFLCSEAGAAITGQNLNVNCGLATY
jgi:NAD(P)-dependent dehydrogenase (short-subunit alcohol dehydrogenase family)